MGFVAFLQQRKPALRVTPQEQVDADPPAVIGSSIDHGAAAGRSPSSLCDTRELLKLRSIIQAPAAGFFRSSHVN